MCAPAEQVQGQILIGAWSHHHDAQLGILAKQMDNRFYCIRRESGLENQNIRGKLCHCGLSLQQRLCLSYYADVVFEREDFAQAGAEDGLRIGEDDSDELARATVFPCSEFFFHAHRIASHSVPCAYARSKWYSSITTPTARRPRSSKLRTTRPRQSICTFWRTPTLSAGNRIVKSTSDPAATSLCIANNTPLAEIFSVSAEYALSCVFTEAVRWSGKLGALCIFSY